MLLFDTIIVGGGPAGIVAAIAAKRKAESVVICEKMPRLGKKILASGNGRCNLLNKDLNEFFYNNTSRQHVKAVFARFGKTDILNFFREIGLIVYTEKDGRIFPVTNQSSSVLSVLEMELRRLSIPVRLNCNIANISYSSSRAMFELVSKNGDKVLGKRVVIAGGGKAYPALGSDGCTYEFAKRFGHIIVEPVPASVPFVVNEAFCHLLQGQKIFASIRYVNKDRLVEEKRGELLFTKYGLSGSAILDISESLSIAINRHKQRNVFISVDMVPFLSFQELKKELNSRLHKNMPAEELLTGILPNKFNAAFADIIKKADSELITKILKGRVFKISGTRGWNEAEFTAGGIDLKEVDEATLESKRRKSLYFAGEILDVLGKRGGYNLAWAWSSGFVAGLGR